MIRPKNVEARESHRIWLEFSDGAAGEVDLSHLAGRGVFAAWDTPGCFDSVRLGPVAASRGVTTLSCARMRYICN